MNRRLLAAAAAFVIVAPAGAQARDRQQLVEVTITNVTRGQILSPPVVATYRHGFVPVFAAGEPASPELAALAEDALAQDLIDAIAVDPATTDVQIAGGPVPPGESVTLVLEAPPRGGYLTALGMLVTTNDGFFAVQGLPVPKRGARSATAPAYDAGSETNNESCAFIPGPPCGSASVRDQSAAEGFVHVHAGIHGIADLHPSELDWHNPVAVVSVRALRGH